MNKQSLTPNRMPTRPVTPPMESIIQQWGRIYGFNNPNPQSIPSSAINVSDNQLVIHTNRIPAGLRRQLATNSAYKGGKTRRTRHRRRRQTQRGMHRHRRV